MKPVRIRISNRVKRNISLTLFIVGIACTVFRVWDVVLTSSSGRAWLNLFGIVLPTLFCFDNYLTFRRRVRSGIRFGSR